MKVAIDKPPDIPWLSDENVRPYVYMRKENLFAKPGSHLKCNWFKFSPIYKNPLVMGDVGFGDAILNLESKAFQKSAMPMPRWVFYDCALVPGFVGGFARKTSTLSKTYRDTIGVNDELDWTPLSLFIIIPSLRKGEWVAHNLCTANSLVGEKDQHYALGFLTKAFGLWYANVEVLCGMTQWQSPSIRLHSHYGPFEILTAYTPIHSYARTLTYRSRLTTEYWPTFFSKEKETENPGLISRYKATDIVVDPKDDDSLKSLQMRIQNEEGPFYLNPTEIRTKALDAALKIYRIS
jgi:hypothetical protein